MRVTARSKSVRLTTTQSVQTLMMYTRDGDLNIYIMMCGVLYDIVCAGREGCADPEHHLRVLGFAISAGFYTRRTYAVKHYY